MKTKILLVIAFAAMVQFSMQDVVTARPAAVAAPYVTAPATTAWPWRGEWGNGWWPADRNGDGVVDWRDSWAWGGVRGDWDPAWGWTGGNWDPAWGWGGWTGGAWDPAWNGRWDPAWGARWAPAATTVAEPVVTRRLGEKVAAPATAVREVAAPAWGSWPAWGGAWDPAWGRGAWNGAWDPAWGWNGVSSTAWDPAWGWGGVRGDWDPAWGWGGWNGAWDPAWGRGAWNGAWDPAWGWNGARVREVPAAAATKATAKAADKK